MSMEKDELKSMVLANMAARGYDVSHQMTIDMAESVAYAVVDHIQAKAKVIVDKGESAGEYPVT